MRRLPLALAVVVAALLALPLFVHVADAVPTDADGDSHDSIATGGDDCDDGDARRYPGNSEVCDAAGRDEDCDPRTFGQRDADGDRWFDARCFNTDTNGRRYTGNDCNDAAPGVHPATIDPCNGIDDNCDGVPDESGGAYILYRDADGDGFGTSTSMSAACRISAGWVTQARDCNDADRNIHPGAGCPTGCQ